MCRTALWKMATCTWQNFRCEKVCCVPPKVSNVLGAFWKTWQSSHHLLSPIFFHSCSNWQSHSSDHLFYVPGKSKKKKWKKQLSVFDNRIWLARLFCQTFEMVLVGCKNWKQKSGFFFTSFRWIGDACYTQSVLIETVLNPISVSCFLNS